jgi:outer membrane protein assembly factor BamB
MLASCGTLIASTMKDGWAYAVNAGDGSPGPPSVKWQFPSTGFPFTLGDGTTHGDIRYLRPGAAWGDVYITMTGGENVTTNVTSGYRRLHALNACASPADRIRWMIDVPGASGTYALGPPTVSRGIVFVGTSSGRLLVIADPSIWPGAGWRCSNPDVPNASCVANGFTFVPEPAVRADVQLDGQILTEPALANGRVYVATNAGKLYMLQP